MYIYILIKKIGHNIYKQLIVMIEYQRRPAFREGTFVIDKGNKPILPRIIRNRSDELGERPSFKQESPKSRLYGVKSKDQLSQEILEREGTKVTLSDKTLTDLYGTKKPRTKVIIDPITGVRRTVYERDRRGNPILDDVTINETTFNGYKNNYDAALRAIEDKVTLSAGETKSFASMAAIELSTIKEFINFLVLQDNITNEQLQKIYSIVSITDGIYDLPNTPPKMLPEIKTPGGVIGGYRRAGIISNDDIKGADSVLSEVYLYLISNAIKNGLSISYPVIGTSGAPMSLSSIKARLAAPAKGKAGSGNQVLDLQTARMFKTLEDLTAYVEEKGDIAQPLSRLRESVLKLVINDPDFNSTLKGLKEGKGLDIKGWTNSIMGDGKFDPSYEELVKETIVNIFNTYSAIGVVSRPATGKQDTVKQYFEKNEKIYEAILSSVDEKLIDGEIDKEINRSTREIVKLPGFTKEDGPEVLRMADQLYVADIKSRFEKKFTDAVAKAVNSMVKTTDIKAVIDGSYQRDDLIDDVHANIANLMKAGGWEYKISPALEDRSKDIIGDTVDSRVLTGAGMMGRGVRMVMRGRGIDSAKRSAIKEAKRNMARYARVQTVYHNKAGTTYI